MKSEIPHPQIRNTQSNNLCVLGVLDAEKYRLENRHCEEACPERSRMGGNLTQVILSLSKDRTMTPNSKS